MIEEYEINPSTLALVPINKEKTMVYEYENEFIVNKSSMSIVDESCKYYGSSYVGRFEGTKKMVGYNYKSPIIIEESTKMIFFPTASPRIMNCAWISLNNIKTYKKLNQTTLITFKNNKDILFDLSYFTLEGQILRSTRLWSIFHKKDEKLKS